MVETITVGAGSQEVISVDDGETVSNIRFDLQEPGAGATIMAMATNWTVKNIAFDGEYGYNSRIIGCADTGSGRSTIRNVYAGDGVQGGARDVQNFEPKFGVWVSPEHSGTLDIEGVNLQGAMDNGFYASAPGSNSNGAGGVVNFRDCYAKNNCISSFRTAGGEVVNCVAVNDGDDLVNPRPLWIWGTTNDGPVHVAECDFTCGDFHWPIRAGREGKITDMSITNTMFDGELSINGAAAEVNVNDRGGNGSEPRDRMPEMAPETADAVFDGVDDEPDEEPDRPKHLLAIGGQLDYRVEFSGRVEPHPDLARWVTEGEAYGNGDDGGWIDWYLTGSDTRWLFDGEVTAIEMEMYDGVEDLEYLSIDDETLTPDEALAWPDHGQDDGEEDDGGDETDESDRVAELEARVAELEANLEAVRGERDELQARLDEYREDVDDITTDLEESQEQTGGVIDRLRGLFG